MMAKTGKEKNTKNKSKHTTLINRVKNKKREAQDSRKARLKEIIKLSQEKTDQ